ncbi:unnamed protein product [Calypogeia fissa]
MGSILVPMLVSLISNDVSNEVQRQKSFLIKSLPYIVTILMITLCGIISLTLEKYHQLDAEEDPQANGGPDPHDTGLEGIQVTGGPDSQHSGPLDRQVIERPHPQVNGSVDSHDHTLHPGCARLDSSITAKGRQSVDYEHNVQDILFLLRHLTENPDDARDLANCAMQRSLENGSIECRDPDPASVILRGTNSSSHVRYRGSSLKTPDFSSFQAQFQACSCGAPETSSQSQFQACSSGAPESSRLVQPGSSLSTDMALTIGTEELDVTPVVEAFKAADVTNGSRILHRRLEIGPQTGVSELASLKYEINESMRRAQLIDKDSTLQIGPYAVLRYTESGPKWWRLQEHWTPKISSIYRSQWSLLAFLFGWRADWTIRGVNLGGATLRASTLDKSENLKILRRSKAGNGEDVLLCEEPYLIQSSAPRFREPVYICAASFVEVEEDVTVNLQSEAKSVKKAYWISVVKGLVPSLWTMISIASLSFLRGWENTHGTLDGLLSTNALQNILFSVSFKGPPILLSIGGELLSFIRVYMITIFTAVFVHMWLPSREYIPPSGYDIPGPKAPRAALEYVTSSCRPASRPHTDEILLGNMTNDTASSSNPPSVSDNLLRDNSSSIHHIVLPAVEEIMLGNITTTLSTRPSGEDSLLEDVNNALSPKSQPPVDVMSVEDRPCSIEDITKTPNSTPLEDPASTANRKRAPPPVLHDLMNTNIHGGELQDSQEDTEEMAGPKNMEADLRDVLQKTGLKELNNVTANQFFSLDDVAANDSVQLVAASAEENDPKFIGLISYVVRCSREKGDEYRELCDIVSRAQDVKELNKIFRLQDEASGSKLFYRRIELGPQIQESEIDSLWLQINEAMELAQKMDKECTLQFGSFAVLQYTDAGPKWWKIPKHLTPIIDSIQRSPLSFSDFLPGRSAKWTIKGCNLQGATLRSTTAQKSVDMKVLRHYKARMNEDVMLCEEPQSVWSSAPLFRSKVYICASRVVEVEMGVTIRLQSEVKSVMTPYWNSAVRDLIVRGLILGLPTIMVIAALVIYPVLQNLGPLVILVFVQWLRSQFTDSPFGSVLLSFLPTFIMVAALLFWRQSGGMFSEMAIAYLDNIWGLDGEWRSVNSIFLTVIYPVIQYLFLIAVLIIFVCTQWRFTQFAFVSHKRKKAKDIRTNKEKEEEFTYTTTAPRFVTNSSPPGAAVMV